MSTELPAVDRVPKDVVAAIPSEPSPLDAPPAETVKDGTADAAAPAAKNEVRIICASPEAAQEFMNWLDEQGEQDLDTWFEVAITDGKLPGVPADAVTSLEYDYAGQTVNFTFVQG